MTLPSITGEAEKIWIPEPLTKVKPFRTAPLFSLLINCAAAWDPLSTVVTAAPSELITVMFLPWKLMDSKYKPGATSTVSPFWAAKIAVCMVGASAGTWMVLWANPREGSKENRHRLAGRKTRRT